MTNEQFHFRFNDVFPLKINIFTNVKLLNIFNILGHSEKFFRANRLERVVALDKTLFAKIVRFRDMVNLTVVLSENDRRSEFVVACDACKHKRSFFRVRLCDPRFQIARNSVVEDFLILDLMD